MDHDAHHRYSDDAHTCMSMLCTCWAFRGTFKSIRKRLIGWHFKVRFVRCASTHYMVQRTNRFHAVTHSMLIALENFLKSKPMARTCIQGNEYQGGVRLWLQHIRQCRIRGMCDRMEAIRSLYHVMWPSKSHKAYFPVPSDQTFPDAFKGPSEGPTCA